MSDSVAATLVIDQLTIWRRNFEISLLSADVNVGILEENLIISFRVGRSRATQIFVIVVAVTNCNLSHNVKTGKIDKHLSSF